MILHKYSCVNNLPSSYCLADQILISRSIQANLTVKPSFFGDFVGFNSGMGNHMQITPDLSQIFKHTCKAKQRNYCQIFTILPKEGHVPNPGSDTWFSNEVGKKIQIHIDMLLPRD